MKIYRSSINDIDQQIDYPYHHKNKSLMNENLKEKSEKL